MVDRLNSQQRSRNMAAIKGSNTKPEIVVRKFLHKLGYRFRLHDKKLPGSPDIVLTKYKTVILVNGCFWHMHSCPSFKIPETRREFWLSKLNGNRLRDLKNTAELEKLGWKVITIWECGIKDTDLLYHAFKELIEN